MKKNILVAIALLLCANAVFAFSWDFLGSKPTAVPANSALLSPGQVRQVEGIVRSYLVDNPDILVDAFRSLRKQKTEEERVRVKAVVEKHAKALFEAPTSPVLGNADGDITLVEFLDYRCGHCKAMYTVLENLVANNPHLRVVIKEYPIFSGASDYAARAALVAQQYHKFAELHKALLLEKRPLTEKIIQHLAADLGIHKKNLEQAMKDAVVQKELDNNVQLAKDLGVSGTPSFLLGDRKGSHSTFIPGATDLVTFQTALDKIPAASKVAAE